MIKQAVILAGGFGTRISEESDFRPKPMVEIGGKPILLHIMEWYAKHGVNEFIILGGYKVEIIKNYFLNYFAINSDFTIDLATGDISYLREPNEKWKVTVLDTGLNTMTGGRLKRAQYLLDEEFYFTYGDGISDVKLNELADSHAKSNKLVTLTRVLAKERFGLLELQGSDVVNFLEKPKSIDRWINAGYFVVNKMAIDLIDSDACIWEEGPLKALAYNRNLNSFEHLGFWKPMDTLRDKRELDDLLDTGRAPWII